MIDPPFTMQERHEQMAEEKQLRAEGAPEVSPAAREAAAMIVTGNLSTWSMRRRNEETIQRALDAAVLPVRMALKATQRDVARLTQELETWRERSRSNRAAMNSAMAEFGLLVEPNAQGIPELSIRWAQLLREALKELAEEREKLSYAQQSASLKQDRSELSTERGARESLVLERDRWQEDSLRQAKTIDRLGKAAEDRNEVDAAREKLHSEEISDLRQKLAQVEREKEHALQLLKDEVESRLVAERERDSMRVKLSDTSLRLRRCEALDPGAEALLRQLDSVQNERDVLQRMLAAAELRCKELSHVANGDWVDITDVVSQNSELKLKLATAYSRISELEKAQEELLNDVEQATVAHAQLDTRCSELEKCRSPVKPEWALETMALINTLTPTIEGKAFNPDWFMLRQRFESMEYEVIRLRNQVKIPRACDQDEINALRSERDSLAQRVVELEKEHVAVHEALFGDVQEWRNAPLAIAAREHLTRVAVEERDQLKARCEKLENALMSAENALVVARNALNQSTE